jgi:undecaprenyl pyrophosphate phosphatase UppP
MRCKVKAVVGLAQCVAAIPGVFDLTTPPGLEAYTFWIDLLELPADFGADLLIAGACFGSYFRRLLVSTVWPIALILALMTGSACLEMLRDRLKRRKARALVASRAISAAMRAAVQRTLPLTLVITFILVPSTATRVFKAFLWCVK